LRRTGAPEPPKLERLAVELLGPDGLTRRASVFDERDTIQAVCQALPAGVQTSARKIVDTARRLLAHPDAVGLDADGVPRIYSTAELLATERRVLTAARTLRHSDGPVLDEQAAERVIGAGRLSDEQAQAVRRLLADPSRLSVVVGPAGAGKTAALSAARAGWEQAGRPVFGAAVAAVTARRLEHATGMTASSLTRLLADLDRPNPDTGAPAGLAVGSVLVIDEASMVGTRRLDRLVDHVQRASGASLVLVGDPCQLPEIDAGGTFAALAEHRSAIRLDVKRRQAEAWERAALVALREGRPAAALDAYLAHDRVHAPHDDEQARQRIVDDYLSALNMHPDEQTMIFTSRRADAADLNQRVRAGLCEKGRLGDRGITVAVDEGEVEFRAGDQVVVTRNDYRRGLLNGTRGQVTAVHRDRLELAADDGSTHTLDRGWLADGRLTHGYAITCHRAQGATVDTALLYGTGALTREAGYVGMSRGRRANHLYTSREALQRPGVGDDAELAEVLTNRLEISRGQTLASRRLAARRPPPARRTAPTPRREQPHRRRARTRARPRPDRGLSR
jgi:ATP-dependent exoDNAse (exonuclease V) alpha subunit